MESGICPNGKWHIPEWKVEYIYQSEMWHIPEWKVAYAKMESGKYQSEMWHIPEWHTPNLYVTSIYVFPV